MASNRVNDTVKKGDKPKGIFETVADKLGSAMRLLGGGKVESRAERRRKVRATEKGVFKKIPGTATVERTFKKRGSFGQTVDGVVNGIQGGLSSVLHSGEGLFGRVKLWLEKEYQDIPEPQVHLVSGVFEDASVTVDGASETLIQKGNDFDFVSYNDGKVFLPAYITAKSRFLITDGGVRIHTLGQGTIFFKDRDDIVSILRGMGCMEIGADLVEKQVAESLAVETPAVDQPVMVEKEVGELSKLDAMLQGGASEVVAGTQANILQTLRTSIIQAMPKLPIPPLFSKPFDPLKGSNGTADILAGLNEESIYINMVNEYCGSDGLGAGENRYFFYNRLRRDFEEGFLKAFPQDYITVRQKIDHITECLQNEPLIRNHYLRGFAESSVRAIIKSIQEYVYSASFLNDTDSNSKIDGWISDLNSCYLSFSGVADHQEAIYKFIEGLKSYFGTLKDYINSIKLLVGDSQTEGKPLQNGSGRFTNVEGFIKDALTPKSEKQKPLRDIVSGKFVSSNPTQKKELTILSLPLQDQKGGGKVIDFRPEVTPPGVAKGTGAG